MASILRVNTLTDASSNNSIATSFVARGSAKAWHQSDSAATPVDSLNISGGTDNGTGDYSYAFSSSMGSVAFSPPHITAADANNNLHAHTRATGSDSYWTFPTRGSNSVYSTSSTSWTSGYNPTSDGLTAADCVLNICTFHGDSA